MKPIDIAHALQRSAATIRLWSSEFAAFLSNSASGGDGRWRSYEDHDLRVLAVVGTMLGQGKSKEEVGYHLKQLEQDDWKDLPPRPRCRHRRCSTLCRPLPPTPRWMPNAAPCFGRSPCCKRASTRWRINSPMNSANAVPMPSACSMPTRLPVSNWRKPAPYYGCTKAGDCARMRNSTRRSDAGKQLS